MLSIKNFYCSIDGAIRTESPTQVHYVRVRNAGRQSPARFQFLVQGCDKIAAAGGMNRPGIAGGSNS